jgi:AraC-like DNA-binding protein
MHADSTRLQQFPVINSVGLDALEAGVERLFGECQLDAPRACRASRFKSVLNYRGLQQIGVMYGKYSGAFDAAIGPYDRYVQGFPLSGYGEHKIGKTIAAVSAVSSAIIAPGDSVKLHFKSTFDHLALVIKPAPLLKKLEALIGSALAAPLKFATPVSYDRPDARALRRLVLFLADESSTDALATSPLVLAELEQTLMVSFLCTNDNNFSSLLRGEPRPGAPWQVRRAEEYIAAHWDQPITIEALAVATNVSARSLYYTFKKARGYSPIALVKQIRLDRARQMLSNPGPATSVTDIAYACGFGNLGHFANDYFRRFGERPSETLRLRRNMMTCGRFYL